MGAFKLILLAIAIFVVVFLKNFPSRSFKHELVEFQAAPVWFTMSNILQGIFFISLVSAFVTWIAFILQNNSNSIFLRYGVKGLFYLQAGILLVVWVMFLIGDIYYLNQRGYRYR